MNTHFGILCILSVFAFIPEARSQQSVPGCPSTNGCPGGFDSNQTMQTAVCDLLLGLIYASRSACNGFIGDNVYDFTDYGVQVLGAETTNEQLCDYFQPGTTVDCCLNPYGSTEMNFCVAVVIMSYIQRYNCSDLYTMDVCNLSEQAKAAIDYVYASPDNKPCAPTPYIPACAQQANPEVQPVCPNCIVSPCPY